MMSSVADMLFMWIIRSHYIAIEFVIFTGKLGRHQNLQDNKSGAYRRV